MIDAGLTDPDSLSKGGEPRPDSKPEIKKERRRKRLLPSSSKEAVSMFSHSSPTSGTAKSVVLLKSTLSTSVTSLRPWISRPGETR